MSNGWAVRLGIGGISGEANSIDGTDVDVGLITVPLTASYLVGKKRSKFEAGLGITPLIVDVEGVLDGDNFIDEDGATVVGMLNIGYRFQAINNGFLFRINWTPVVSNTGFHAAWFGFSLGYTFKP